MSIEWAELTFLMIFNMFISILFWTCSSRMLLKMKIKHLDLSAKITLLVFQLKFTFYFIDSVLFFIYESKSASASLVMQYLRRKILMVMHFVEACVLGA